MHYEFLTEEQRKSVKESTLVSIESDHLANKLAFERAQAADDQAQMKVFTETMVSLEKQKAAILAMGEDEVKEHAGDMHAT